MRAKKRLCSKASMKVSIECRPVSLKKPLQCCMTHSSVASARLVSTDQFNLHLIQPHQADQI